MVNLVYQCWIGDMNDKPWILDSVNLCEEYAKKLGAEYIFGREMHLRDSNPSIKLDRYFNILDLIYHPKYKKYDHILYLDVDVFPDKNARDIFQVEGLDSSVDIVGASDTHYSIEDYWDNHLIFKEFGSKLVPSIIPYIPYRFINTGVIVFTKRGRERAKKYWDVNWADWKNKASKNILAADQPYINAMINKHDFKVLELDTDWNYVPWSETKPLPKCNFYHLHLDTTDFHQKIFEKNQNMGFTSDS